MRYITVYSSTPIEEEIGNPGGRTGTRGRSAGLTPGPDRPGAAAGQPNDERKAPLINWVLKCAVFGILMLLFAFQPPMCRRMMQQMQMNAQAVREKINNETEEDKK